MYLHRSTCLRTKGTKDGLKTPGRSSLLYLTSLLFSLLKTKIPALLAANASNSVHQGCPREMSSSVSWPICALIIINNAWSVFVAEVFLRWFFAVLEVQFGQTL